MQLGRIVVVVGVQFGAVDGKVEVSLALQREHGSSALTAGITLARAHLRSQCGLMSTGVPALLPTRLPHPQVSVAMRTVASFIHGSRSMASR